MLTSQQTLELRDNSQQQHAIQQRIVSLKPQVKSAEKRLSLAVHQAALAVSVMERYKKLADTHYVSDIEYQQKQIDVSTSQQNVEDQRQGLLQLHTAMEAAKDDLDHLIVQGESRKAEMDRQLQVIRQQQDELAGKENFTLTSPVSGTVAAVLVRQGQSVRASEPVMTLIPDNARLQIELYATSQNAGFIQAGQRVALRFSAFPYQKFGVQSGEITNISPSLVLPGELVDVPISISEPAYLVTATLSTKEIMAYGNRISLKAGMTFSADVHLSQRTLMEWLMEPLYSITGKL